MDAIELGSECNINFEQIIDTRSRLDPNGKFVRSATRRLIRHAYGSTTAVHICLPTLSWTTYAFPFSCRLEWVSNQSKLENGFSKDGVCSDNIGAFRLRTECRRIRLNRVTK